MYAFALAGEVMMPALVPVAVGAHSRHLEYRFGSVEGPPMTGDVEPIADEVSACPFDDVIKVHLR